MDIINEVQVIENDIEDVKTKCNKIQCNYIYDAINSTIKLIIDAFRCLFKCKYS